MEQLKVLISPTLLQKLNILSSDYDIEVGGYLTGEIKSDRIILKDLLIPDQMISRSSVVISGQDQLALRKKFGNKVTKIIGHWHSHHSLGCFWSTTDETDMRNIMSFRKFFVWIVSSRGKHLIRVSQRDPFGFDFNNCEFKVNSLSLDFVKKRMDSLIQKSELTTYHASTLEVDEIEKEIEEVKDMEDGEDGAREGLPGFKYNKEKEAYEY